MGKLLAENTQGLLPHETALKPALPANTLLQPVVTPLLLALGGWGRKR